MVRPWPSLALDETPSRAVVRVQPGKVVLATRCDGGSLLTLLLFESEAELAQVSDCDCEARWRAKRRVTRR